MLTAVTVKNAARRDVDYKLSDAEGLYLFISKTGFKSWRVKYRFGGKERRLVLGSFPPVSLAEAREQRDEAKRLLKKGVDPALFAKRDKLARSVASAQTFEQMARQWHAQRMKRWKPVHANDVIRSLERDVFGDLGAHDVDVITSPMVLAVLKKIEARGAIETAHRIRQRISKILRFANVQLGGIMNGNAAADLEIVMTVVPRSRRRPALLKVQELQELTRVVEHAGASPVTKLASRFLALTAQRPGTVQRMLWENVENIDWADEFADVSEAQWRIPAQEMKQEFDMRENDAFEHIVPLAPQAVAVLRVVRLLSGRSRHVFPSATSMHKHMSENAVGYLYNREGYKGRHCPHGWRSSFSTIENARIAATMKTDEAKIFYRFVIDLMLAHMPKGISVTERDYNRAAYMDLRRELAIHWADLLLDGLPEPQTLLDGPRRRYRE